MEIETYSVNDVAKILSVKSATVRRWITANKIPSFRIGHTRRIPKSFIQDLMKQEAKSG